MKKQKLKIRNNKIKLNPNNEIQLEKHRKDILEWDREWQFKYKIYFLKVINPSKNPLIYELLNEKKSIERAKSVVGLPHYQFLSRREIDFMSKAGDIVVTIHKELPNILKAGITPIQIDKYIENRINELGGYPVFKGFQDFPNSSCISVNQHIAHAIPTNKVLSIGDIVKIDIGAAYKDYVGGDCCFTYIIDKDEEDNIKDVNPDIKNLVNKSKELTNLGISYIKENLGSKPLDINSIAQYNLEISRSSELFINKSLTGHGLGYKALHIPPLVFHHPIPFKNEEFILPGIVFSYEPIYANMVEDMNLDKKDKWTLYHQDTKGYKKPFLCSQFELIVTFLDYDGKSSLRFITDFNKENLHVLDKASCKSKFNDLNNLT